MAGLGLDDLLPKAEGLVPKEKPEATGLGLEDLLPKKKEDLGPPMPGLWDAATAGVKKAFADVAQSKQALSGQTPTPQTEETSPAAEPFGLQDLAQPINRGLPKLVYGAAQSSPSLAGGILGGLAGSIAGPLGTTVGGAGGAAVGAALQTVGPAFAQELKKQPTDPEGAWTKAVEASLASGAGSGASWALFPYAPQLLNGPVKKLAFQALGLQPGISVAEKAVQNVITGDPATKDLGTAYTQGAVGATVPALGHLALRGKFGEPETIRSLPDVAESSQIATDLRQQAAVHRNNASQPGVPPDLAQKLNTKADNLETAADWEEDRHQAGPRAAAKIQQANALTAAANAPGTPLIGQQTRLGLAGALRQDAREDLMIANLPRPRDVPSGGWGQMVEKYKQTYFDKLDPSARSESALQSDSLFARYKSIGAKIADSLFRNGNETYKYKWEKVPMPERLEFLNAYEYGQPVPANLAAKYPWMDNAARDYREQLKDTYAAEKALGSKAGWLENYFPHMWKDTARAADLFKPENLVQSMGSKWFQHARDYDLIQLGLDNGLELRYDNPQDMITQRLKAGADMVNKMKLLESLQEYGVAMPLEKAPAHIRNPALIGGKEQWQPINAPNREQWLISPEVQSLWKNAVEAKGLWDKEGIAGDAFRSWMWLKSGWVQARLGFSLFHPNHVIHIFGANNISRALGETFGAGEQGLYRRFIALPEAMFQSLTDPILAAIPKAPFLGKEITKAWGKTEKELSNSPREAAMVRMVNEAGISAQLSEQLRMKAADNFHTAMARNQYLRAMLHGPLLGYEKTMGAIFEKWIPSLKMAALQREMEAILRRRPDLLTDEKSRLIVARAKGKQIDNRFGEMFYGSLFWDRTLKDASIGSFLSLGWNLGFAREFGGGAFEPIVRRMIDAPNPTRKLIRDTTNKTTNMFTYTLTAMAINGMINKGFTGDDPQGVMDLIFPRIGGLNPDGSPRRVTNAFYTREVPMALKHIQERQSTVAGLTQMLYHKLLFQPFVEMGTNRDYFGNSIYDENAPGYKQIQQFVGHLMSDQLSPMSLSGAKRALELSGKPHDTASVFKQLTDRDVVMPYLGFGPAPAYVSKDAVQNRIQFLFKKYVAPEAKSFDVSARSKERSEARTAYMIAKQNQDQPAIAAAAQKLSQLGVATKEIGKIHTGGTFEYMFSRLPAEDQVSLLKTMDPENFKKYFRATKSKKVKADQDLAALYRRYLSAP